MRAASCVERRDDGTTAVIMEPLDFVARLAALAPAPRRHQLRYHGTLAPNAAWRKFIVPQAPEEARGAGCGAEPAGEDSASRTSRLSWAELLRRVFEVDVLKCRR